MAFSMERRAAGDNRRSTHAARSAWRMKRVEHEAQASAELVRLAAHKGSPAGTPVPLLRKASAEFVRLAAPAPPALRNAHASPNAETGNAGTGRFYFSAKCRMFPCRLRKNRQRAVALSVCAHTQIESSLMAASPHPSCSASRLLKN